MGLILSLLCLMMASMQAAERDSFVGAWYTPRGYARLYAGDIFLRLEIRDGGKMRMTSYLIEKNDGREVARVFREIRGSCKVDGDVLYGVFEEDPAYPLTLRITRLDKSTLLSEESLGGTVTQVKYLSEHEAPWSKIKKTDESGR